MNYDDLLEDVFAKAKNKYFSNSSEKELWIAKKAFYIGIDVGTNLQEVAAIDLSNKITILTSKIMSK